MTIIKLRADDQVLSAVKCPTIASGDQNTVMVEVCFDSSWDGYSKTAAFYTSADPDVFEVILDDDTCVVPFEVLTAPGTLYIGIRGIKASDKKVKTSTIVGYRIKKGAPISIETANPPTPDVYQQLLKKLDEIKGDTERTSADAEEALRIAQETNELVEEAEESARKSANDSMEAAESAAIAVAKANQATTKATEAEESARLSVESSEKANASAKVSEEKSREAAESALESAAKSAEAAESARQSYENSVTANKRADESVTKSTEALAKSEEALTKSKNAVTKSTEALNKSTEALTRATEVEVNTSIAAESASAANDRATEAAESSVEAVREVSQIKSQVTVNSKRISNLEKGLPDESFLTDSEVSYAKTVPENALPYAEVGAVGGMTRKCTNLFNINDIFQTENINGQSFTIGSGSYYRDFFTNTIGEAAAVSSEFYNKLIYLNAGEYVFSWESETDARVCIVKVDITTGETSVLIRSEATGAKLTITEGTYITIRRVLNEPQTFRNFMLNEGDTALPYEPYFDELRSAPVTEVESVGANLFDMSKLHSSVIIDGQSFSIDGTNIGIDFFTKTSGNSAVIPSEYFDKLILLEAGDYTISFENANNVRVMTVNLSDGTVADLVIATNGTKFSLSDNTYITLRRPGSETKTYSNFQINKGDSALPYTPYVRNTLAIPDEVKALDGYGWGVNESVFNYIDWEKKQFVKRVEKYVVPSGKDVQTRGSNESKYYYINVGDYGLGVDHVVICNKFNHTEVSSSSIGVGVDVFNSTSGSSTFRIAIRPENTTGHSKESIRAMLDEWYNSGDPLIIYYELTEPVITDISHLLTSDNLISAEGNGTITMVNEHKYDVPSEITYMLKGE